MKNIVAEHIYNTSISFSAKIRRLIRNDVWGIVPGYDLEVINRHGHWQRLAQSGLDGEKSGTEARISAYLRHVRLDVQLVTGFWPGYIVNYVTYGI